MEDPDDEQGRQILAQVYMNIGITYKEIEDDDLAIENFQLALDLYTQAARQGYLPAIRVMSQVYEKGQLGLAVSYTEAIAWLNAGVEANDRWSIQRLSRAYRRGELGLKIDREQADRLEARLAAETPAAAAGE